MKWKQILPALALTALGCGGAGSGAVAPDGGGPNLASAQEQVVVEMDINGDDRPDLVTLDTSKAPFEIVEAFEGTATGRPLDVTDLMRGRTIDPDVTRALAEYLAGSFGVATRAEIDCQDKDGEPVTVVVME